MKAFTRSKRKKGVIILRIWQNHVGAKINSINQFASITILLISVKIFWFSISTKNEYNKQEKSVTDVYFQNNIDIYLIFLVLLSNYILIHFLFHHPLCFTALYFMYTVWRSTYMMYYVVPTSHHIQSTYFMHLSIKKPGDFSKMIEYQRSYAGNCISILKQLGLYYTARRRYDGGCHAGQGRQAERPAEAAGPFRKWISFSSVVAS